MERVCVIYYWNEGCSSMFKLFRKDTVIFLFDGQSTSSWTCHHRETRGSQIQARQLVHQLFIYSHIKTCQQQQHIIKCREKKTPLEDYYVSAKLSLTKFDGKTHKLLNLELLVKIRLKMYRCEQSGTNDQGHTAAVERSAVPVSSWLGRGRRSRTPI